MSLRKIIFPLLGLIGSLFCVNACYADIVISGTRVIYPEKAKSVSVKLDNHGQKPLLVQSWIDDGRENVNPQELNVPFMVTPPVSRIDPDKGQTIKIAYLGSTLPQDKESMFWLNVLEIPPKPSSDADQNILQLAFRTRIKVFFRPTGLKGSAADAIPALKWKARSTQQGWYLDVSNPSSFHVSFSKVSLVSGKSRYEVESQTVKPGETQSFKIQGLTALSAGSKIECIAFNDYGGTIKSEITL